MRWTLLLLAGCIKSPDPLGFAGGGIDVKESDVLDTGDSGDSGGGGSTEGPVITSFDVAFEDGGNLGVIITGKIAYTDTPDDVVGGTLFFQLAEGSGDPSQYTLDVVAIEDLNVNDQQTYQDPDTLELIFSIAEVDADQDYAFTEVKLKDNSGNTSESVEATVAAGSYTGE
jgi:hypothetical protein